MQTVSVLAQGEGERGRGEKYSLLLIASIRYIPSIPYLARCRTCFWQQTESSPRRTDFGLSPLKMKRKARQHQQQYHPKE